MRRGGDGVERAHTPEAMEADTEPAAPPPPPPPPVEVAYDPLTGIPAEYNEYLPNNCEEFKRCGGG